jgi:hypothetical protein
MFCWQHDCIACGQIVACTVTGTPGSKDSIRSVCQYATGGDYQRVKASLSLCPLAETFIVL